MLGRRNGFHVTQVLDAVIEEAPAAAIIGIDDPELRVDTEPRCNPTRELAAGMKVKSNRGRSQSAAIVGTSATMPIFTYFAPAFYGFRQSAGKAPL